MEIAKGELQASRDRGFVTLWQVATRYQIEDGVVVRMGNPFEKAYPPMSHPELPTEIAKLQRSDENQLLNFLNTYGELGYVYFSDRRNKKVKGDPIPWIWAHAQTIQFCLELINALQNQNGRLLKKILNSEGLTGQSPNFIKIASGPFIKEKLVLLSKNANGGVINFAEVLLFSIINNNIKNFFPKLIRENEGPKLRFTFSSLVEVAYWQLANSYIGGWLKRCEACGALFLQTDQRQTFCPKGLRKESLCASRDRLRRFRNKTKAKSKRIVKGK